ncbi:MAG: hypothetical protein JO307_31165 [Bryobacterales bacterium]|nr:hypothetical protein [Bryobacterales bacterium]MBV9397718.1 hypothetical protein [Bryobacterales bacterium]
MFRTKTVRSQFTESEAAQELGVSVDEFRALIRAHATVREEDLGNLPVATYHPSDLLLLRLLSAGAKIPPA